MTVDVMDRPAVRKKNETASNSTEDQPPEINLAGILHKCRLRVAEQYHSGCKISRECGDGRALVAVACGALLLEAYVASGSLVPSALNQLRDVADNLGVTKRCGGDVVDCCIGVGAALFAELKAVYEAREAQVAA